MKVYLSQIKCPQGHCIVALAGEFETATEAEALRVQVVAQFDDWVAKGVLNRKCGLCGSADLHPDLNATVWTSMKQAADPLRQSERNQQIAAADQKAKRN